MGTLEMSGGPTHPHIHLQVNPGSYPANVFRDLYRPTLRGFWTKDIDPICIPAKYLDPEQWPDT